MRETREKSFPANLNKLVELGDSLAKLEKLVADVRVCERVLRVKLKHELVVQLEKHVGDATSKVPPLHAPLQLLQELEVEAQDGLEARKEKADV